MQIEIIMSNSIWWDLTETYVRWDHTESYGQLGPSTNLTWQNATQESPRMEPFAEKKFRQQWCQMLLVKVYLMPHHTATGQSQYNSVQMFEPFQDRNQHLFETVSLS